MEKTIKETTVTDMPKTENVTPQEPDASVFQTVQYLIYFIFGTLDVLLIFRLLLKLLGASTSSGFVNFIYGITGVFVYPFEGIFRALFSKGVETSSVFEPSTVVAIIVYAILAWGIVELVRIMSGKKQEE